MSTPTEGSTWTYFTWRGCSKCGETDGVTFRVRPGAIPESKCACGHEDVTKPHKFAPSEASTPTGVALTVHLVWTEDSFPIQGGLDETK
ncbi:hypothetical protein LCGC14_2388720 [marine sediment metagenome]|uniref:Uncharacterized protein n=1 Tax=marine sediment metagenome TaxID=412755 RepID=A0A0F9CKW6_9ZZZZ